ncbi:MAG: hypothetical protein ABUS79_13960 [Pseudomonadota bacterium]
MAIHGLATGGDAVGRQQGGVGDGRTTFVALAAPGERVQVRLVRRQARVAWGELIAIHQDPLCAARVAPPCPLFGRCGGCQWQHVDLGVQRAEKRKIVARALGLPDVPLLAPVETGQGYRDRAQLVVGGEGQIGFRARRSHLVVDVERCHLFSSELARALDGLRAGGSSLPAGTEIDLQCGREGVHVAVTMAGPADAGAAAARARALLLAWASAGVVGVRVRAGGGEGASGAADVDLAGPEEAPLRIPAGVFAQVGRAGNGALIATVLDEMGRAPGAVLELYAGSGNFTRAIAARATRVFACDADGAAVARGRRHVPAATWSDRAPSAGQVDADIVLADPPREGLDGPNLAAAVQARRRFVYVSCDPQTLGRDAARVIAAGFVLRRAVALDLMPHTFHVEVVATFDRAVAPPGASVSQ